MAEGQVATAESEAKKEIEYEGIVGFFVRILQPGVSVTLLNLIRGVIVLMTCFFFLWPFVDYNIHYIVMGFMSLGFLLSFEYFSYHLKQNPDIMNPKAAKAD